MSPQSDYYSLSTCGPLCQCLSLFFNIVLSLCPSKALTSAQTDILCSGRQGEMEGEVEKVMWVITECLEMSSWRWKLFVVVGNISPLLSSPLLFPSPFSSIVRAINMGFSSPLVLRSSMSTWLLLKASSSRRNAHYETKVWEIPD